MMGSGREFEFASSGNTTIITPDVRNRSSYIREQDICIHGRRLHDCRLCKGRGICIHKRRRRQCALCGNPRDRRCPHGMIKYDCIDCKGGGICIHQRRRRRCKECGFAGKSIRKRKRQKADATTRTRTLQGTKRLHDSIDLPERDNPSPLASTVTNRSQSPGRTINSTGAVRDVTFTLSLGLKTTPENSMMERKDGTDQPPTEPTRPKSMNENEQRPGIQN